MQWFWCTEHHAVEEELGCRAELRLGPYPSYEAAARALEAVAERTTRLDEEDRQWED